MTHVYTKNIDILLLLHTHIEAVARVIDKNTVRNFNILLQQVPN